MNKPLVTIILPVRDSEEFLKDCVKSIKAQSYRNFEVIAIDDDSRDNSYLVLKKLKGRDKRFRVYKNKTRYGLRITLNRAIKKTKGNYIAFMDQRSINYKQRIATQLDFLLENPKIAAVGTQCRFIDQKERSIGKSEFPIHQENIEKDLIAGLSIQPETFMINKEVLPLDLLRFENETYPYLYTDLFMKIIKYAAISNLPRSLVYFRKRVSKKGINLDKFSEYIEYIRIWIKTLTTHEKKPSVKSLFAPLVEEI